jgi:hypothetical protein
MHKRENKQNEEEEKKTLITDTVTVWSTGSHRHDLNTDHRHYLNTLLSEPEHLYRHRQRHCHRHSPDHSHSAEHACTDGLMQSQTQSRWATELWTYRHSHRHRHGADTNTDTDTDTSHEHAQVPDTELGTVTVTVWSEHIWGVWGVTATDTNLNTDTDLNLVTDTDWTQTQALNLNLQCTVLSHAQVHVHDPQSQSHDPQSQASQWINTYAELSWPSGAEGSAIKIGVLPQVRLYHILEGAPRCDLSAKVIWRCPHVITPYHHALCPYRARHHRHPSHHRPPPPPMPPPRP